ncbi:MAG: RIP metalloprotease RseP [Planctomycetota bacterium]|nr:RIP metalloprotease RseP [Planctomycetota bacterium]
MIGILETLLHILTIVVGVGFLIFVHELGHFIVAKKMGVRVEAFSLGFGPVLIKFKRGDTEYRLSVILIGGYVKMAGENPGEERTGAPYELQSQPPMRRLPIFMAGSVMNFLAGFPLCILAYLVGMNLPAPEVSTVREGSSEWDSLMMPGDVIETVDGVPVKHLDTYRKHMMKAAPGSTVSVQVRRNDRRLVFPVEARGSTGIGVLPAGEATAGKVKSGSPAEEAGIRAGDRFLEIDGKPVLSMIDFQERIQKCGGKSVQLKVRGEDGSEREVSAIPRVARTYYEMDIKQWLAFQVDKIKKGGPADGVLMPGDIPLEVNGAPARAWGRFTEAISSNTGNLVRMTVEREGKPVEVEMTPVVGDTGKGKIFVTIRFLPVIASAPKDSPLGTSVPGYCAFLRATAEQLKTGAAAQVRPVVEEGARIVRVAGESFARIEDTFGLFVAEEQRPIAVTFDNNGVISDVSLAPNKVELASLGVELVQRSVFYRADGFFDAVKIGFDETMENVSLTLVFLVRLVGMTESPRDMAGPIGIAGASYAVVRESFGRFLWLLSLLSLSLAIFNMLPVPILDGGHVAFLVLERLRGKPLSEKYLIIAQYVGLLLLLSLVVFVTYADIARLAQAF